MKLTSRFSIYCLIFHSVYFFAGSTNEPVVGFEVVNDNPSHTFDIWLAAATDVLDRYGRSDHSSNHRDSGIRNDPQEKNRMSDHERTIANESRNEPREKGDHTLSRSTGNNSQFQLHGPHIRKISQPGITFKSDALFDSRTSLPDWSATDFCDAIIAHNEIRYQEFNESRLWLSGKGRKIFIKRKLVDHVIRRYPLYKNPEFIHVIKTLPFVRESIANLEFDIRQVNFLIAPDDHARKSIRKLHEQFESERRNLSKSYRRF